VRAPFPVGFGVAHDSALGIAAVLLQLDSREKSPA
jgi:hypothetical protein